MSRPAATARSPAPWRQAPWRQARWRARFYQTLLVVLVAAVCLYLFVVTSANLQRLGISSGFGFLGRTSGFDVAMTLIDYDARSTYARAFMVGVLNTLLVSALAIVLGTIVGFLVGIARLSPNWLLARIASAYVEINRNIPLLLHLFIWYFAVLRALPGPRDSLVLFDLVFINNRAVYAPAPIVAGGFWLVPAALVVALIGVGLLARWARQRREATGRQVPMLRFAVPLVIALPALAAWVGGGIVGWEVPELRGFNFRGGWELIPELVALVLALTVYHGAYIAEIVRGGINSVDRGQREASAALGLRDGQTMRLVLIPQAMRVIVPQLGNSHISILKDSSLAAAIAYPDLMLIFAGTVMSQTGQPLEVMAMTMAVYLAACLGIALLINLYNRRVRLVER